MNTKPKYKIIVSLSHESENFSCHIKTPGTIAVPIPQEEGHCFGVESDSKDKVIEMVAHSVTCLLAGIDGQGDQKKASESLQERINSNKYPYNSIERA